MSNYPISIKPFGIHAVLVEWPNRVEEEILEDILLFSDYLKLNCLSKEEWELVPSYNSLTLIQNSEVIDFDRFAKQLKAWYSADKIKETIRQRFLWRLPVCYDLDFGIDLQEVSDRLKMPISEIVELHTATMYTVYAIGFLPGFMYLGGLAKSLEAPRKAAPRLKIVKGAVGLAGKQTGIYPQESPGGWNIIGNCSVSIFDPKREKPCIVNVGDKVQFYSISRAEYNLHKIEGEVGIYQVEKIKLDA